MTKIRRIMRGQRVERAAGPSAGAARACHLPRARQSRRDFPRLGSLREMLPAGRRKQRAGRPSHGMPIKVQLLPMSLGDRSQMQSLTTFLINDNIAIDAGSLGFALPGEQLAKVEHVILTHSHLDHVASLPIAATRMSHRDSLRHGARRL